MRMWLVPTDMLCRQHLLGEHNELHMLRGALVKGKSVTGYVRQGLIDIAKLGDRHSELVKEMRKRGYNHQSRMRLNFPQHRYLSWPDKIGSVDVAANITELKRRCSNCRTRSEA